MGGSIDTFNYLRRIVYILAQLENSTVSYDTGIPITDAHQASLVSINVIVTGGTGSLKIPSSSGYYISGGTLWINIQNPDPVAGHTADGKIEVLLRHTILNTVDTVVAGPLAISVAGT